MVLSQGSEFKIQLLLTSYHSRSHKNMSLESDFGLLLGPCVVLDEFLFALVSSPVK